jgi:cytochrome b involved in lipid metabolism
MSTTTAETRTHIEFKDKEDARAWFKANNNSD